MNKIRTKLLVYFIIISLVPILIISIFFISTYTDLIKNNIISGYRLALEQRAKNMDQNLIKIQSYMDVIYSDKQLKTILSETDFLSKGNQGYDITRKLDELFRAYFFNDKDIRASYLLAQSGGGYIYNGYVADKEGIKKTPWYQSIKENKANISWIGEIDAPHDEKCFAVAREIWDMELNFLGDIVVLLRNDIFTDICDDSSSVPGEIIFIIDDNGRIIAHNGSMEITNIKQYDFGQQVLNAETSFIRSNINKDEMMVMWKKSQINGWKIVHIRPYGSITEAIRNFKYMTIFLIIIILIITNLIAYFISRSITIPIGRVVSGMKKVGEQDFDVVITDKTNDEIGIIIAGFNNMVRQIKELFVKLVEEEQSKRKAEMQKLQYQINPHFLYNTLASIRMKALMNHDETVANMLMILGRMLRNTLTKVDRMVTIQEEMDNLKDFIEIIQIRHANSIQVQFEQDDKIGNCLMPGMMLQPILENAVMHGLGTSLHENMRAAILKISMYAKDENSIVFEIYDNGAGMTEEQVKMIFASDKHPEPSKGTHIGLQNIHERIKMQFGNAYGVEIVSKLGEYTMITVTIPIIKGENY